MITPWGESQRIEIIAPGIAFHTTVSHGGYYLSSERNKQVQPCWRKRDGWYEEDLEKVIVILTFPEHFTHEVVEHAHTLAKMCYLDKYNRVFRVQLSVDESNHEQAVLKLF